MKLIRETRGVRVCFVISILIFVALFISSYITGVHEYRDDITIFILLSFLYYFNFSRWNLTIPIYALLTFGNVTHALGVFGFYSNSPFPMQWDHITHFFGALPFAMLFFQILKDKISRNFFTWKNLGVFVLVILLATGVGAVVELSEFVGFLVNGFGNGALAFGTGDGFANIPADQITSMINVVGGGWINEGWDFVFNTIGILVGLLITIKIYWVLGLGEFEDSKKSKKFSQQ